MPDISLRIKANADQAVKELQGLEKAGDKAGRSLEGVGRSKGRQSAEGVQGVNRELERLIRNTEGASKKVRELETNLRRVGQQKGSLMGFVEAGAANPAQLKELEALRRYERTQSRSLGHYRQVLTDRRESVDRARAALPPTGEGDERPGRRSMWGRITGAVSDAANGGGVKALLPEGQMGEFAGGLAGAGLGPFAALGIGAGAALLVKQAYDAASKEQKVYADLLPRLGLGGAGLPADPAQYMGHLRDTARPLGYSGLEALQVQNALSAGGGKGMGLQADTKTAMQFARVFGIDAGQAGTILASGERMGAFSSGQGKRFAEQLAREIAITGLGPRAAEVQEQTLALMNQQMQNSGSPGTAAIMALQTALNKTGIPALTGAAGGNLLATMNQNVTNPGSDAKEAIFFRAYRELGVKNFPQMLRAQEKGIAYPGLLGQVVHDMEKNLSPDLTQVMMRDVLGVPMNVSAMWQARAPGHHISNMLRGKTFEQQVKMLQMPGLLDKETEKVKQLPGSQLRRMEATTNDALARAGTPIVKSIGSIADFASKQYTALLDIAKSTGSLAARFAPGHLATVPDGKGHFKPSGLEKHLLNPAARAMAEGWDWFTDQGRYSRAYRMRHRGDRPPVLPTVPGSGAPQRPHVGAFRPMGHGAGVTVHHHHRHVIEEHGVVSDASKQALKRTIREVTQGEEYHDTMVNPKSNYRGMH